MFKSRIALFLAGALLVAACGSSSGASDQISVVSTTSIWGDVVSEIVGDDANVAVLIPRDADAHDYQPTPQQVASLLDADLVVANGLGLEEGLHDVLENAESDGANVMEVAPGLDPIPFVVKHQDEEHEDEEHEDEAHEDEAHEDEEHDHGALDPHVWFDPQRVALAAEMIATELTKLDDSVDWMARAEAYASELDTTDAEMSELFSSIPADRRKLVTNHDAFGYLADRYGLEVVGVVIPGGSTLSNPSSAELASLVHTIEDQDVDVIFSESSQPTQLAAAVATEVGRDVAIVELYTGSLGEEGTPADTLSGMLLENARRIADALG